MKTLLTKSLKYSLASVLAYKTCDYTYRKT